MGQRKKQIWKLATFFGTFAFIVGGADRASAAIVSYNFDSTTAFTAPSGGDLVSSGATNLTKAANANLTQLTSPTITNTGTAAASGNVAQSNSYTSTDSTLSGADAATEYLTFSITAPATKGFNLSSLDFDLGAAASSSRGFVVKYSFNNTTFTTLATATAPGAANAYNHQSIALADQAGELTTSPVYFRLYGFAAGGTTAQIYLDNLTVNGTVVPAPEPTAAALLGLCAFSFLRRRSAVR